MNMMGILGASKLLLPALPFMCEVVPEPPPPAPSVASSPLVMVVPPLLSTNLGGILI